MNTIDWSKAFFKSAAIALVMLIAYAIFQAAAYFGDVLTILVGSMLLAYVLQLPVDPLSRRMPRWLAVGVVVVAFLVLVSLIGAIAVPMAVDQLRMLLANLPSELDRMQGQLDLLQAALAKRNIEAELKIQGWIMPRLEGWSQQLAAHIPSILMGSFASFFSGAMLMVSAFYFLKDGPRIRQGLLGVLPRRLQAQVEFFFEELDHGLNRYVRGQVLNASVVLIAATVTLPLLGMNYGLIGGVVWGVAEVIPYFGTYVGVTTVLVLAALQGGIMIKVLIATLIIWWTKDNIIAPRVMSHTTGLHPILIILAVLAGGKVAGLLGVLLAIPLSTVLWTAGRLWLLKQKEREDQAMEPKAVPETTIGPSSV
ncbi:pheromone autoinducer 2 transporter [compost metagenome]